MHLLPMYYFKVVVKNRSINKAAQELHITQQTLSAHMNSVDVSFLHGVHIFS